MTFFKSGANKGHMKDFMYIKCCAKGFFSEISILVDKWLAKKVKKNEKMYFNPKWFTFKKLVIGLGMPSKKKSKWSPRRVGVRKNCKISLVKL